ncbi:hypothetical protein [uncultured Dialister sp.]|uniref:hypothetical protein n=1 Tax=Dialister succinatiphilus TaxID=487173 RepID=UPI002670731E|nr:hypothetical protein [uncultured Dialister sp.]
MTYQDVTNIAGELGWAVSVEEGRLHFCFRGEKDYSFAILASSAVELISKIRLLAYNYAEDRKFKGKLDELTSLLVKEM